MVKELSSSKVTSENIVKGHSIQAGIGLNWIKLKHECLS